MRIKLSRRSYPTVARRTENKPGETLPPAFSTEDNAGKYFEALTETLPSPAKARAPAEKAPRKPRAAVKRAIRLAAPINRSVQQNQSEDEGVPMIKKPPLPESSLDPPTA